MADLVSCYFCGAVEDVREYPVIPPDLDPPDGAQRTVAVCPPCREKLGRVLEPVVGFLGEGAGAAADPGAGGATAGEEAEATTGRDAPGEAGAGEPAAGEAASEGTADGRPADDPPAAGGPDGTPTERRTREGGADATATDREPTGEGSRGEETSGDDRADGERTGVDAGRSGVPEGTKQVARLLQNREFPVERAEIETLASSAYDLGPEECRAAVDALIERGYLAETDGTLHRPGRERGGEGP